MDPNGLADLFGPPAPSPSVEPTDLLQGGSDAAAFDFDPDNFDPTTSPGCSSTSTAGGSSNGPAERRASASVSSAHSVAGAPVDPEELKKRIQGSGSSQANAVERAVWSARVAVGARCRWAAATCRQLPDLNWRGLPLAAAIFVVLCIAGIWATYRGNADLEADVAITSGLPTGTSLHVAAEVKDDAGGQGDDAVMVGSSAAMESLEVRAEASEESASKRAGRADTSFGSSSGSALSSTESAVAEELAALRRAVVEGDRGLREEIAALRSQLSKISNIPGSVASAGMPSRVIGDIGGAGSSAKGATSPSQVRQAAAVREASSGTKEQASDRVGVVVFP